MTGWGKPVNEEFDLWNGLVAVKLHNNALRSTQLAGHLGVLVYPGIAATIHVQQSIYMYYQYKQSDWK